MKHYLYLLITIIVLGLGACQESKEFILEAPLSKVEGISDTWKLTKLEQLDLLTNISERSTLDLTTLYIGTTPMAISFAADGNYTLDPGTTLNFIGGSGTWAFNNDDYPTQVYLTNSGNSTTLQLFAPTRAVDNTLDVGVIQYCTIPDNGGIPQVSPAIGYRYVFSRQ